MVYASQEIRREKQLHKLGLNVKRYRELSDLNRPGLVDLSGVSSSVIAGIEAPNMFTSHRIATYLDVAEALEIPPHVLMDLTTQDSYRGTAVLHEGASRKERRKNQIYLLGVNLQHYRRLRKLDKPDLAVLSGVSLTTIKGIEAPKMFVNNEMGTWIDLAYALGIPLHHLFDFTYG